MIIRFPPLRMRRFIRPIIRLMDMVIICMNRRTVMATMARICGDITMAIMVAMEFITAITAAITAAITMVTTTATTKAPTAATMTLSILAIGSATSVNSAGRTGTFTTPSTVPITGPVTTITIGPVYQKMFIYHLPPLRMSRVQSGM